MYVRPEYSSDCEYVVDLIHETMQALLRMNADEATKNDWKQIADKIDGLKNILTIRVNTIKPPFQPAEAAHGHATETEMDVSQGAA